MAQAEKDAQYDDDSCTHEAMAWSLRYRFEPLD